MEFINESWRSLTHPLYGLNLKDKFGSLERNHLHKAVAEGNSKLVKAIINEDKSLLLEKDKIGCTPLHLASISGNVGIVKLLLIADPTACNVKDEYERTPLHVAIDIDDVPVMKALLPTTAVDTDILHFSIRKSSRLRTFETLVEHFSTLANVNVLNTRNNVTDGDTLLHTAARLNKLKIMKYLLHFRRLSVDTTLENYIEPKKKALDMVTEEDRN
ncbi:hypothetical protein C5167_023510 [Papaver somniferum]|uniref:Uncharacterized protein n=1 Tax=Papaver somniferum TaxID=3469 RepID=A0A4Y7JPN3_PAPSO|nr:ankyrin repeat domain-containing protein 2-like [Papaver somniferum]RZC61768.1 hypothetical protein C5167_023510 [Papaver somniferum]